MYEHTQRAPLYWLLLVPGLLMLASAPLLSGLPVPQAVLIVSGLFMLLLTMAFRHLTIRDEQEHLLIQFGPLPLFRRRLRYGDICGAARGRTTVLDGWGIHLSPLAGAGPGTCGVSIASTWLSPADACCTSARMTRRVSPRSCSSGSHA
ncbi:MAG: hypothetical protein U0992_23415 [Planctomycetaceae bacterium]